MGTTSKKFDCVEMKRQAQAKLRTEYERRKGEFSSLEDFLNAKAQESRTRKAREGRGRGSS